MKRQISDNQPRLQNVLDHLLPDHARLPHLIGTHNLKLELIQGRLYNERHHKIRMLTLIGILCPYRCDVEANISEIFRVRQCLGRWRM